MRYFPHTTDHVPERWRFLQLVRANIMLFVGMLPWRFRKNHLTEHDFDAARHIIERGDVVLVGGHRRLGIFFFRSTLVHALLYTGEGTCIHAIADGVEMTQFSTLFRESDTLVIWRPAYHNKEQVDATVAYMESKLGMPFDFGFNPVSRNAWFCTELVCNALRDVCAETTVCRENTIVRASDFLKENGRLVFHSESLVVRENKVLLNPTYYSRFERLLFG